MFEIVKTIFPIILMIATFSSETLCNQVVSCDPNGSMVISSMLFQFRCRIPNTAVIDTPYYAISSSGLVALTLTMTGNRNIAYLPRDVYKKFPDLRNYLAASCAIVKISNENFEHLVNLTTLNLNDNNIDRIESGTFGGLKRLISIDLSE